MWHVGNLCVSESLHFRGCRECAGRYARHAESIEKRESTNTFKIQMIRRAIDVYLHNSEKILPETKQQKMLAQERKRGVDKQNQIGNQRRYQFHHVYLIFSFCESACLY